MAIIGLGLRLPGGAGDPAAFWRLLRDGVDAVSEVPAGRWDLEAVREARPAAPPPHGGFLEDIDRFDAEFFGISPREAASLDPQQRLLLETAWHALEDAGLDSARLAGSDTGVFVGISTQDYARRTLPSAAPDRIDAYSGTGSALSAAAGRLAYFFDFRGPAVATDTACSSSLVAIHQACRALRDGECALALAGGVNAILSPELAINFSRARMLAPDGRCKAFAAEADGYVRSEGCGLVVLKRLADALAAGDPILAVIRGSAVSQDGRSNGLTAPNGPAQERVIRNALASAGVAPAAISYVEAHGTGTALGDPIEAQALGAALGAGRPAGRPAARRLGQDEPRAPRGRRGHRQPGQGRPRAAPRRDSGQPAFSESEPAHSLGAPAAARRGSADTLARAGRGRAAPRGRQLVRVHRDECPPDRRGGASARGAARGERGGSAAPAGFRAHAGGRAPAGGGLGGLDRGPSGRAPGGRVRDGGRGARGAPAPAGRDGSDGRRARGRGPRRRAGGRPGRRPRGCVSFHGPGLPARGHGARALCAGAGLPRGARALRGGAGTPAAAPPPGGDARRAGHGGPRRNPVRPARAFRAGVGAGGAAGRLGRPAGGGARPLDRGIRGRRRGRRVFAGGRPAAGRGAGPAHAGAARGRRHAGGDDGRGGRPGGDPRLRRRRDCRGQRTGGDGPVRSAGGAGGGGGGPGAARGDDAPPRGVARVSLAADGADAG